VKKGLAMLDNKALISDPSADNPRADLGIWLKSLREACGLSQRQLATMLSLDYYTFISQLENGRGKIPSGRYLDWAQALNQDPRSFVKSLLSHYDSVTYGILFDPEVVETVQDTTAK
jgi:transcriptional regulator with XRE-family HTH domain